jgi:hypothetical protein
MSRMRCETRFVYHTYRGLTLVGVLPPVPSLAEGVGRWHTLYCTGSYKGKTVPAAMAGAA